MTTKRVTTMLLGVSLVFCMAGQGQAGSIQYNVFGTFDDGGTLGGTLSMDYTLTNPITGWELETSGGINPAGGAISSFMYNEDTSKLRRRNNSPELTFIRDTQSGVTRRLTLKDYNPYLDQLGDSYSIGTISEKYNYINNRGRTRRFTRDNTNSGPGTADTITNPEPASLLLFGSGLIALGYWRYRQQKQA